MLKSYSKKNGDCLFFWGLKIKGKLHKTVYGSRVTFLKANYLRLSANIDIDQINHEKYIFLEEARKWHTQK